MAMTLQQQYGAFVRSYQHWHYRMTPGGRARFDACTSLSILQGSNVFSISFLAPLSFVPSWLIVSCCAAIGFAFYIYNRRLFDALQIEPNYPKWSDNVPGYREFSAVYNYLLATLLILILFPMMAALHVRAA
jgi:hypothetical protein